MTNNECKYNYLNIFKKYPFPANTYFGMEYKQIFESYPPPGPTHHYYHVHIRHNPTGEIRISNQDHEWNAGGDFLWTEGNYGCDCNRYLEFERAAGIDPDWDKATCSDGKYTVIKAVFPDGSEYFIDREL